MAKIITPTEPVPTHAFHFAADSLQDVFELMLFVATVSNMKYIFEMRCIAYTLDETPAITASIMPKGAQSRKEEPIIPVKNTDWVIWNGSSFSVVPNSDVAGKYDVEDAPPPDPNPPASEPVEGDSNESESQPG